VIVNMSRYPATGKDSDMSADSSSKLSASKSAGDGPTSVDDPEIVQLGPITKLVASGGRTVSEGPVWAAKDNAQDDHR
jgi:hypothetical protein